MAISARTAAVKAELTGPNAANYVGLSDAAVASLMTPLGILTQDVPVAAVAAYVELYRWQPAAAPTGSFVFEEVATLAAGPASATQVIAAKLHRICTDGSPVTTFQMSIPAIFTEMSGMLDLLVAAGMEAANKANILALAAATVNPQDVTEARAS